MGTTVYVEDFDPKAQCWNRTLIIDANDFDNTIKYDSKYGGITRIRYVDENGKGIFEPEEKNKPLTPKLVVDTLEPDGKDEIGEEKTVGKKPKKKKKKGMFK
jgi:hypothetical protein